MTRLLFGLALIASFCSASNSLAEMPDSPFSTARPQLSVKPRNFMRIRTPRIVINREETERQTGVVESHEEFGGGEPKAGMKYSWDATGIGGRRERLPIGPDR